MKNSEFVERLMKAWKRNKGGKPKQAPPGGKPKQAPRDIRVGKGQL